MSKIARQIAATLLAHDYIPLSRGSATVELIDRVFAGKIIKKSTYDHLKRVEADYYSNFDLNTVAGLYDQIETLKVTCKSNLNNWLLTEQKLKAAEAELNQYRQAEEVESKLDNDLAVRQEEVNRKCDEYSRLAFGPQSATWTWRGEPTYTGMNVTTTPGKESITPQLGEVLPESNSVTEQQAESPSKWRDLLSCIGFKN